jgi:hypothetical protein
VPCVEPRSRHSNARPTVRNSQCRLDVVASPSPARSVALACRPTTTTPSRAFFAHVARDRPSAVSTTYGIVDRASM